MKRLSIISILLAFISSYALAAEVNVFSARHYDSDIQLYEKFTAKTGIKVNVVSGKDKALQKRIIEEGADCIGDLYLAGYPVEGYFYGRKSGHYLNNRLLKNK